MPTMGPIEMDSRERRFVATALRRSAMQSSIVKALALGAGLCWSIACVAFVDATDSMEARVAFFLGLMCLGAMGIAAWVIRRRKLRDALLAVGRCGCCGHKLHGSRQVLASDVHAKTCSECGTNWTDLDRRDSISLLYGCA